MECLLSLMPQQLILCWRNLEPVLCAVLLLKLEVDFTPTAGTVTESVMFYQLILANK